MSGPVSGGNCCLPGDITVTKIPTGYLLGRATRPIDGGKGPWWEYIAIVTEKDEAMHQAATIARMENVCAWLHVRDDEYERIWPRGGGDVRQRL